MKQHSLLFRLTHTSIGGGLLLVLSLCVALTLANSPLRAAYEHLLHSRFGPQLGPVDLNLSLHEWINDLLMAVFFFAVGVEIKFDLLIGKLASRKRAALPVFGALGGMILPAMLYLFINPSPPENLGWGVPMATDIAFSLGVIALLGRRVPSSARSFLVALAIVDDLGAVLVIAIFYTASIAAHLLAAALALAVVLAALQKRYGFQPLLVAIFGAIIWYLFLRSGVHATIAGVITALTVPSSDGQETGPLLRTEHVLRPWVNGLIMPLFALANAGISFDGAAAALTTPVSIGIIVGLFVGKQAGILSFAWLSSRFGLADLPHRTPLGVLWGLSVLGGIGFTMSIFIATLAFPTDGILLAAKAGILVASALSAIVGAALVLRFGEKE